MMTVERCGLIDQALTSANAADLPRISILVAAVGQDRPQRFAMRDFKSLAELLSALGRQVVAVRVGRRWRGRAR